jgi:hypothetical protein
VPGKERERLMELCALAAQEQDHSKLLALVKEITTLLETRDRQPEKKSDPPAKS